MANGCRTFFRVILGILTALFLIIGLFMLGFGIALKVDPGGVLKLFAKLSEDSQGDISNMFRDMTDGAAIFMIVLGCITTVISFIGFAGAVSGSTCLLVTYAVIMFIFLGAEIALIVVVAGFPEKLAGKVSPLTNFTKEDVFLTDRGYAYPPNDTNGRAWYLTQNYFECCGIVSYTDYDSPNVKSRRANGNSTAGDLKFPISCCKKMERSAFFIHISNLTDYQGCLEGKSGAYNEDGCVKRIIGYTGAIPIAIAGITLGLEVLLIICSIVIACLKDHSKL